MGLLDAILGGQRAYRQWRGGTWREIYALPYVSGGFHFWTRNERPYPQDRVLYTEYWPL